MTSWNAAGRLQGRTDIPLSPAGVEQARQVARALEELPGRHGFARWSALYSSPLLRAQQTAQEIEKSTGRRVALLDGLLERSFGILEGRSRDEVDRDFPNWQAHDAQIEGLETRQQLRHRVLRTLGDLGRRHLGEAVIAVTHGGFLRAFFAAIVPDARQSSRFIFSNCGYSIVTYDDGWHVLDVNVVSHLETDEPASGK